MSRVDVVIPCYKYAHFLRGCVQSVLSQTGVDVRVLIIDDCSPDNTAEIGSQLAAEDSRVRFRRHEVNRGHIATYNEGLLEWAGGDFTMILSADDLLVPGALRRAAKVMTDHPEVGMTFGDYLEFDADLPPEASVGLEGDSYPVKIYSHAEFLTFACDRGQTGIAAPTAIVRTEVQRRVGGYIPALPHSGDTEMWLRLSHHSGVAEIGAVQALKRSHATNMMHSYNGISNYLQHRAAFEAYFASHDFGLEYGKHQWRRVNRVIAGQLLQCAYDAFERDDATELDKCLSAAWQVCPAVVAKSFWWKLQVKRVIGLKAVGLSRIIGQRLRGSIKLMRQENTKAC